MEEAAERCRSCRGSARWLPHPLAAATALRSGRPPPPVDGGVRLSPGIRLPPLGPIQVPSRGVGGGHLDLDPTHYWGWGSRLWMVKEARGLRVLRQDGVRVPQPRTPTRSHPGAVAK